jgi:ribosomal protein S18 acetylase RimI-like enzyme
MTAFATRGYVAALDVAWATALLGRTLGGRVQARRGELVDVLDLPGIVAVDGSVPIGILTYQLAGGECELAAIAADRRHAGVGTALLQALRARAVGCRRIWLITTNDNLDALRFYQRRGFRLAALYPEAVLRARLELKPAMPATGAYGIPLRDELELELLA